MILNLNDYSLFQEGKNLNAIHSIAKNDKYSESFLKDLALKEGFSNKDIFWLLELKKESFTYKGMPSEKSHPSGLKQNEISTLEDSGFKFVESRNIWSCDVNKDTIITIKKDPKTLFWNYRLQKKEVSKGWDSTKSMKATFSFETLDECLSQIKRKLIDENLIEEKYGSKKKFNLN